MTMDIDKFKKRIERLEGTIQELIEFIENFSDVVDGDDGQPEPNHAMYLIIMAQNVLDEKHDRH